MSREIIERFHRLYYRSGAWKHTKFLGVQALKCPLDLWVYQEALFARRPDVVVECGSWKGGSGLWLATVCELIGHGEIVSVDALSSDAVGGRPNHPRLRFLHGNTADAETRDRVRELVAGRACMVLLDDDHSPEHVQAELELYAPLVTPGQMLVVEDTNAGIVGSNRGDLTPVVDAFLENHPEFYRFGWAERHLLTLFPGGWLERCAGAEGTTT